MRLISALIIMLVVATPAIADRQNLDEVMARKTRHATNTFYANESATYYFWQPETLSYVDTNYGTEVWRVTNNPLGADQYSNEYSTQAWSADGSRLGFRSLATIRASGDPNKDGGTTPRWTMMSDGSKMRAGTGRGQGNDYLNWLHTENAYLFTPRSSTEFSGALTDSLYKVTLDANNGMTRTAIVNSIGGTGLKSSLLKDPITSNDKWLVLQDETEDDWPTPNDINSRKLHFINLTTNAVDYSWGVARGIGPVADPYGEDVGTNEIFLRGSSSAVLNPDANIYAHFSNWSPHFFFKKSGHAADGGPQYEDWDGDSFGVNEEIKALDDNPKTSTASLLPHNPYDNGYMGHPAFDRWGHYVLANNSQDCGDVVYGSDPARVVRWGNNSCGGLLVLDVQNNLANPSWVDANNSNYMIGTGTGNFYNASHSSWTGWTDTIASMNNATYDLFTNNYKKTSQTGKTNTQAPAYLVSTELYPYRDNYAAYPRPSQSPDGTKVAFSTILFSSAYAGTNSDDDKPGISYVVAYYPHPPFVRSLSATGGTATLRVDWDLSGTPRGYTARGWPSEATDNPPPPREIAKFRLWKSADKTTWTAVKTFDHSVWSNYNFATGAWSGNAYWDVTDTVADGTYYYAVTSVETSNLESRTLSNIYAITVSGGVGTGTQDTAYPADPKGKSNFYTTAPGAPSGVAATHQKSPATTAGQYTVEWTAPSPSTLVRYYNIYALDGSDPTAIQQRRIASIPATSDYDADGNLSYVDWLGKTDGTTKYAVTAVDFQGNESGGAAIVRSKLSGGGKITGGVIR